MKIDKPGEEKQNWTGYGTAEQPAVILCYHIVDKHGTHRLVSINNCAISDIHGDREAFERHLGERYRSFELVGSCQEIVDLANHTAALLEDAHELKRRCEELRARHGEMCVEPWMPEPLNQQKVDKTEPPTAVPDDEPGARQTILERSPATSCLRRYPERSSTVLRRRSPAP